MNLGSQGNDAILLPDFYACSNHLCQQTLNLQEKPHRQNRWIMSFTQYRPGVPVQRALDKLLTETER